MFHNAVRNHNASIATTSTSPHNASYKQASLSDKLGQTSSLQNRTTCPLVAGAKQTGMGLQGPAGANTQGIKRTSSGLAKHLGSQEDLFSYPTMKIAAMEKENRLPPSFHAPSRNTSTNLATALFDDDDFDSDIDLDVEDPATKGTVTYPTLPRLVSADIVSSRDSGYASRLTSAVPEPDSSQPIPWSSSPSHHFKTPPKPAPIRTKRRQLPWTQVTKLESVQHPNDLIESDEETPRAKNPKPVEPVRTISTPASKGSVTQYAWNTTASAIKEQQRTFKEKQKTLKEEVAAKTKTNKGTEEDIDRAAKRKKRNSVHRIFLSEEQHNVLNLVIEHKKSVFFTGSAGTGKSVLLREIIAGLRKRYVREPDRVAVTASTGLAACNIGGVTLHSFAGIGLGKEPAEDLVKKIRRNAKAKQRWLRTKVLIMDEVSMVDGELFDKLEQIARTIRNNGRPFGGIQLVITGDFFQLPPVPESGRQAKFAFDACTWTTSIEHTIGLHHVFRQKDPVFANMLNEMREGRLSQDSIARFRTLSRDLPKSTEDIEATELFPTRPEVDRANESRMKHLEGREYMFDARDGGTAPTKEQRDRLLQHCMVPERLTLKKGAQVMLVKNMDDTLVNGSLGKVTMFMTEQMFNSYKEDEEAFLKSGPSEEETKQMEMREKLGVSTQQIYPIVRFAIADGTTRDLLCKREEWKVELPNGEVQASRSQIPLILAWALSIHKAQGQTLERVRVDLGRVFEKGQAYVALSRATSMAGLQILRFDPRKVIAHEKVRLFYSSLSRAEQIEGPTKSKSILGKMQAAKAK
ncbi:DNA helicase [Coniothyrium glycines]